MPDAYYAERPADRELPAALLRGELCWVLGPPQVGKTSLRLRAQERLEKSGRLCAAIDLGLLGTHLAEENWYRGLLEEIAAQLGLRARIEDFWQQQGKLAPVHRFSRFLRERLPSLCDRPVVLFFDEIEATLSLPFPAGDFFESLRALHSAKPARRRVTCCLLGVADPGDLAADPGRSPFHAGRGLRLEDLSPAEAEAFLPGLRQAGGAGAAEELLAAVLAVTDGHPYMTQRLCEALSQQGQGQGPPPPAERVAALVQALFLQDGRTEDASLVYAERRFCADKSVPVAERLQLYRRLLAGEAVRAAPEDPAQAALRLCGLAAVRRDAGGSWLRVRNRVFARVFDAVWVKEREAELDRPIAAPLRRYLEGGKRQEFLLRGPALAQARAWAAGRGDVNAAERDLLIASLEAARAEDREAARRRHTTLLLPLSVALLLLGGLVLSLGVGERRAKERALAAEEALRRACPGPGQGGQEEPGLASRRSGDLERAEAEAAAAREREARAVADAQAAAAALRETRAALDRAQEELRNKVAIQVTPLGQQGAEPPAPPPAPAAPAQAAPLIPPKRGTPPAPQPVATAAPVGKPAQQPTPPPPAPPKPQPPAPPKPQPPPPQKPPMVPPRPQPVLAAAMPLASKPAPPPVTKPAPPVTKPAPPVARPAPTAAKPAPAPPAGGFCAAEKAKGPAASGRLLRDAMARHGKGDHGQAVKLAECALQIRQGGKNRAELLEALDTLGLIFYQAGNYSRAEGLYRQALQIRQAQDPGSPEVDSTQRILRLIAQKRR